MDRDTAEPRVASWPGERARAWSDRHRSLAATSTHLYDFVWDVTADADGPFCTDVDGNVLLDFTCHVASAPLGYNHPAIVDRLREFDLVDPLKIAGQDFVAGDRGDPGSPSVPGPVALMDRLVDIAPPGMDTVFLSNSGAEAVENAIKVCYDYRNGAPRAITFDGAFHGRTLGALSLNRSKAVHRRGFPSIPGVESVPYCLDRGCDPGTCACGFFPDADTSRLGRLLDPDGGVIDPAEVAYVILEPIQGEGGYRIPSEAFLDEVARVCGTHGIPVVADEIQSGVGRTGEWWASDRTPIEPDVITAGKALRVGATVSRSDVFPDERARLSSTWGGGDVLSSFVGVLTIDAIREEGLLANAVERGRAFLERVRDADPSHVLDVRGVGLMLAVEFDRKARRDAVMECCLERGLLTLPAGVRTLRVLPPLDVTERELDLGIDLLLDAVEDRRVRDAAPTIDADGDVT